jgi:uncharacterized protein YigE (DUF2233 family)
MEEIVQSLINKAGVKKFALEVAKQRFHKFSRVSKEFLDDMDAILRGTIRARVNGAPSKGKTL